MTTLSTQPTINPNTNAITHNVPQLHADLIGNARCPELMGEYFSIAEDIHGALTELVAIYPPTHHNTSERLFRRRTLRRVLYRLVHLLNNSPDRFIDELDDENLYPVGNCLPDPFEVYAMEAPHTAHVIYKVAPCHQVHCCPDCDTYFIEEDGNYVEDGGDLCPTCIGRRCLYSEYLGRYIYADDAVCVYANGRTPNDGDPNDYVPRHYAEDHMHIVDHPWGVDYMDSDSYAVWVEEDEDDCPHHLLYEYGHHGGDYDGIPTYADNMPTVGLELELNARSGYTRGDVLEALHSAMGEYYDPDTGYDYKYCGFERDSSLDERTGFETVTNYGSIAMHREQLLTNAREVLPTYCTSPSECGLHVHVDTGTLTPMQAGKLYYWVASEATTAFIEKVAGRKANHYCSRETMNSRYRERVKDAIKWLKDRWATDWYKLRRSSVIGAINASRYQAINFGNPSTVEFRIFASTTCVDTIIARMEFAFLSVAFVKEVTHTELTPERFMAFICQPRWAKDSVYLRKYLDRLGVASDGVKKSLRK